MKWKSDIIWNINCHDSCLANIVNDIMMLYCL